MGAKKKKAAKKRAKPQREERSAEPLTAAEVKRFQKILEQVGTRKRDGFIFMATGDGKVKGEMQECEGLIFAHRMSKANIVGNLINTLRMNPLEVISILADVQAQRTMGGK